MQQLSVMADTDLHREGIIALCMKGDSMEPDIKNGEWFLVNKRDTVFSPEGIFLIAALGTFDVVRLQYRPDTKTVRQWRSNPLYSRQEVSPEHICVLGRVVGIVKRV